MTASRRKPTPSHSILILEALNAIRRLALAAGRSAEDAGLSADELARRGVKPAWLRALEKDNLVQSRPCTQDQGSSVATIPLTDKNRMYILTPAGIQGMERPVLPQELSPVEKPCAHPEWDGRNLKLIDRGVLVLHYKRRGAWRATLLDLFQQEGWPAHLRVPDHMRERKTAGSSLVEAVKRLNHDLEGSGLVFWTESAGAVVCWQRQPARPPRSKKIANTP